MKPKRLARRAIYKSAWVNLYLDRVRMPDGRIIPDMHFLNYARASVGALVKNRKGQLLFVRAYRYTTDSIGWEIPAGNMEKRESVLKAAQRETLEETGYRTRDPRLVYSFYPTHGISNKQFHIVRCEVGAESGIYDRNEIKEVLWLSRAEIRRMLRQKRFKDGLTLAALLFELST